jgi:hypothetical protein
MAEHVFNTLMAALDSPLIVLYAGRPAAVSA